MSQFTQKKLSRGKKIEFFRIFLEFVKEHYIYKKNEPGYHPATYLSPKIDLSRRQMNKNFTLEQLPPTVAVFTSYLFHLQ